jgi:hypothetical protein
LDRPSKPEAIVSDNNEDRAGQRGGRAPMVRSALLGSHEHQTACGKSVQIWQRGDRYLARGRYNGQQFGETLSGDRDQAASSLRRLLVAIEDGTFRPPSERRRQSIKTGSIPRLTVRELCERFLSETRQLRGKQTYQDYCARLVPLIELAEQADVKRRCSLATDVDRSVAMMLRTALHSRNVTRNGHPSAAEKRISPRQIYNVLDCARTLFHWAKKPDVNLLPTSFINPFSREIVGDKPKKDPLRPIPIPFDQRIKLVVVMDAWQLCHFALSFVLPLRPEDFAGLLISEIDFEQNLLQFGTRLDGQDFNKGRQSFVTPFPPALRPLLQHCVDGRAAGPLLRKRPVFEKLSQPKLVANRAADVVTHFNMALQKSPEGEIRTAQDSKRLFRRVLRDMGGVSEDALAREFKLLLAQVAPSLGGKRLYDLRASCSSELERSGVSHLVQRYVTGHTTDDIMFEYNSVDPVSEMNKYFVNIEPLLAAIMRRATELGLLA